MKQLLICLMYCTWQKKKKELDVLCEHSPIVIQPARMMSLSKCLFTGIHWMWIQVSQWAMPCVCMYSFMYHKTLWKISTFMGINVAKQSSIYVERLDVCVSVDLDVAVVLCFVWMRWWRMCAGAPGSWRFSVRISQCWQVAQRMQVCHPLGGSRLCHGSPRKTNARYMQRCRHIQLTNKKKLLYL